MCHRRTARTSRAGGGPPAAEDYCLGGATAARRFRSRPGRPKDGSSGAGRLPRRDEVNRRPRLTRVTFSSSAPAPRARRRVGRPDAELGVPGPCRSRRRRVRRARSATAASRPAAGDVVRESALPPNSSRRPSIEPRPPALEDPYFNGARPPRSARVAARARPLPIMRALYRWWSLPCRSWATARSAPCAPAAAATPTPLRSVHRRGRRPRSSPAAVDPLREPSARSCFGRRCDGRVDERARSP